MPCYFTPEYSHGGKHCLVTLHPNTVMVKSIALLLYTRIQSWWRALACYFTPEYSHGGKHCLVTLHPNTVMVVSIALLLYTPIQSWWRALPCYFTPEYSLGGEHCLVTLQPNACMVKGIALLPYNQMSYWKALPQYLTIECSHVEIMLCFFTTEYSHSEGHYLVTFRQKCNDFTLVFSLLNKNLLLKSFNLENNYKKFVLLETNSVGMLWTLCCDWMNIAVEQWILAENSVCLWLGRVCIIIL